MPYITKPGCMTFYCGIYAGELLCDITDDMPIVAEDGKTVIGFNGEYHTYDDYIGISCVGPSHNGKHGYVGLYLTKDREMLNGYTAVDNHP